MERNLRFFYFGHQCPHNATLMTRIRRFAVQKDLPLRLMNISQNEGICQRLGIFSPNMLLVNDRYRPHGPFSQEKVRAMVEDEAIEPEGYEVKQSEDVIRGDLVPLTSQSVLSTCRPCMRSDDETLCSAKSEWVARIIKSLRLKHLGYLHFLDGVCVGGAEFLPSQNVPYPIPDKRKDNAFLTCSFLSDEKKDYKTDPLMRLIDDLRAWGFRILSVAASRDVVFPNGPLRWFENKWFVDKGVLVTETLHKAKIHYLQLKL